jgi:NADH-quinone oxidoreductase subunit M
MRGLLAVVLLLVALVWAPRVAWAEPSVAVRAASGDLPMELQQESGSFNGKLVVRNKAASAVTVKATLLSGDDVDPRLPAGMTARFLPALDEVTLSPGQQRELTIDWLPPRGQRIHELYGRVLLDTGDSETRTAVGFHLVPPGSDVGLAGHLLSILILVPFVGAVAMLLLRGREPRAGSARSVLAGAAVAQLLVLAWASSRFDVGFTRFFGGDGLQLVERVPLVRSLGIEWFLAIDGISLVLAVTAPMLVLVAAFSSSDSRELAKSGGLLLLLDTAMTGLFVSFDLAVLWGFLALALVAALLLVAFAARAPRLPRGLAIAFGASIVLVGVATWQLSGTAAPAWALNGTRLSRVFDLAELGHGGYLPATATWLGVHPVKAIYAFLFLGSLITMGVPPFHGWLGATLERIPAPVAVVVAGGLPLIGTYVLVRVGYAALPTGTAWAAPALGVYGLVAALYAALALLAAGDMGRAVGRAAALASGLVLVGLSSLTAIGLQSVLLLLVSRALWVALLVLVVAWLRARHGTTEVSALAGVANGRPLFGALAFVGLAAAAGAPGTLTFLGEMGVVAGALPLRKLVALLVPIVLLIAAAGCGRLFLSVFTGERRVPEDNDVSGFWDDRVPLALAICLVGLGLAPRPLTSVSDSACLDQAERPNPPGVFEVVDAGRSEDDRVALQFNGYSTAGSANENSTVAASPDTVE